MAGLALLAGAARGADWHQLKTPHFTVFSETSEGKTRDWAVEFELFRRAMNTLMPVDPANVEPVTLVLFRSDRRLKAYKPQENGRASNVAGYFTRSPGRNYIALSVEGPRDYVREIIFHEGVHWHLAASARPRPLWLEEGLAQLFGNFRLAGNAFVVGSSRPEAMRYVRVARPMPYEDLAAVQPGGLGYNGRHADLAERFYHQSWVTVHALVFGVDGLGTSMLYQFLSKPAMEGLPSRDFEAAFSLTPENLDARVAAYMASNGRHRTLKMPFDRSAVEAGFALAPASDAEADLALGNLLIGVRRAADAGPHFARAFAALGSDPRPSEGLGIAACALEKEEDARLHLLEAERRGSTDFLVYYLLGMFEAKESRRTQLGRPDVEAEIRYFVRAVRLNPRFEDAQEALAIATVPLMEPSPEVQTLVRDAAERFLNNFRVQAACALYEARFGEVSRARRALERARASVASFSGNAEPSLKAIADELARRSE